MCVCRGGGCSFTTIIVSWHKNETMNYAMLCSDEPHTHVHTYKRSLGTTKWSSRSEMVTYTADLANRRTQPLHFANPRYVKELSSYRKQSYV